jgi:hypothetical protein
MEIKIGRKKVHKAQRSEQDAVVVVRQSDVHRPFHVAGVLFAWFVLFAHFCGSSF